MSATPSLFAIACIAIGITSAARAGDVPIASRVCVGKMHCVGSGQSVSSLEREFGFDGGPSTMVDDHETFICFRLRGMFVLTTYSAQGQARYQPEEIDVATTPQAGCRHPVAAHRNADSVVAPVELGATEATVRSTLGAPRAVWSSRNSDHDIPPDGIGWVRSPRGDPTSQMSSQ